MQRLYSSNDMIVWSGHVKLCDLIAHTLDVIRITFMADDPQSCRNKLDWPEQTDAISPEITATLTEELDHQKRFFDELFQNGSCHEMKISFCSRGAELSRQLSNDEKLTLYLHPSNWEEKLRLVRVQYDHNLKLHVAKIASRTDTEAYRKLKNINEMQLGNIRSSDALETTTMLQPPVTPAVSPPRAVHDNETAIIIGPATPYVAPPRTPAMGMERARRPILGANEQTRLPATLQTQRPQMQMPIRIPQAQQVSNFTRVQETVHQSSLSNSNLFPTCFRLPNSYRSNLPQTVLMNSRSLEQQNTGPIAMQNNSLSQIRIQSDRHIVPPSNVDIARLPHFQRNIPPYRLPSNSFRSTYNLYDLSNQLSQQQQFYCREQEQRVRIPPSQKNPYPLQSHSFTLPNYSTNAMQPQVTPVVTDSTPEISTYLAPRTNLQFLKPRESSTSQIEHAEMASKCDEIARKLNSIQAYVSNMSGQQPRCTIQMTMSFLNDNTFFMKQSRERLLKFIEKGDSLIRKLQDIYKQTRVTDEEQCKRNLQKKLEDGCKTLRSLFHQPQVTSLSQVQENDVTFIQMTSVGNKPEVQHSVTENEERRESVDEQASSSVETSRVSLNVPVDQASNKKIPSCNPGVNDVNELMSNSRITKSMHVSSAIAAQRSLLNTKNTRTRLSRPHNETLDSSSHFAVPQTENNITTSLSQVLDIPEHADDIGKTLMSVSLINQNSEKNRTSSTNENSQTSSNTSSSPKTVPASSPPVNHVETTSTKTQAEFDNDWIKKLKTKLKKTGLFKKKNTFSSTQKTFANATVMNEALLVPKFSLLKSLLNNSSDRQSNFQESPSFNFKVILSFKSQHHLSIQPMRTLPERPFNVIVFSESEKSEELSHLLLTTVPWPDMNKNKSVNVVLATEQEQAQFTTPDSDESFELKAFYYDRQESFDKFFIRKEDKSPDSYFFSANAFKKMSMLHESLTGSSIISKMDYQKMIANPEIESQFSPILLGHFFARAKLIKFLSFEITTMFLQKRYYHALVLSSGIAFFPKEKETLFKDLRCMPYGSPDFHLRKINEDQIKLFICHQSVFKVLHCSRIVGDLSDNAVYELIHKNEQFFLSRPENFLSDLTKSFTVNFLPTFSMRQQFVREVDFVAKVQAMISKDEPLDLLFIYLKHFPIHTQELFSHTGKADGIEYRGANSDLIIIPDEDLFSSFIDEKWLYLHYVNESCWKVMTNTGKNAYADMLSIQKPKLSLSTLNIRKRLSDKKYLVILKTDALNYLVRTLKSWEPNADKELKDIHPFLAVNNSCPGLEKDSKELKRSRSVKSNFECESKKTKKDETAVNLLPTEPCVPMEEDPEKVDKLLEKRNQFKATDNLTCQDGSKTVNDANMENHYHLEDTHSESGYREGKKSDLSFMEIVSNEANPDEKGTDDVCEKEADSNPQNVALLSEVTGKEEENSTKEAVVKDPDAENTEGNDKDYQVQAYEKENLNIALGEDEPSSKDVSLQNGAKKKDVNVESLLKSLSTYSQMQLIVQIGAKERRLADSEWHKQLKRQGAGSLRKYLELDWKDEDEDLSLWISFKDICPDPQPHLSCELADTVYSSKHSHEVIDPDVWSMVHGLPSGLDDNLARSETCKIYACFTCAPTVIFKSVTHLEQHMKDKNHFDVSILDCTVDLEHEKQILYPSFVSLSTDF